jgi:tRNA-(ms[2]io[6]A)-hydroxylase
MTSPGARLMPRSLTLEPPPAKLRLLRQTTWKTAMTRRSVDLHSATDPAWVAGILGNFDAFLADHANCERKASALAMSLVVKHPDRVLIIPALIDVAREELEHFQQVYQLMQRRGLRLVRDEQDPYVNALLGHCRHGRDSQLLDRLLIASVVECRGAERFRIVAGALTDPELAAFYDELWKAETKHGHQFVDMALRCFPADEVYQRLQELMQQESAIVASLPWRASLH